MGAQAIICYKCSSPQEYQKIGFRDSCLSCGAPLHCCLNCAHYSPGAYNDCAEPNAERVLDKAAANFCEYFLPKLNRVDPGLRDSKSKEKQDLFNKLDSLFKK